MRTFFEVACACSAVANVVHAIIAKQIRAMAMKPNMISSINSFDIAPIGSAKIRGTPQLSIPLFEKEGPGRFASFTSILCESPSTPPFWQKGDNPPVLISSERYHVFCTRVWATPVVYARKRSTVAWPYKDLP